MEGGSGKPGEEGEEMKLQKSQVWQRLRLNSEIQIYKMKGVQRLHYCAKKRSEERTQSDSLGRERECVMPF